MVWANNQDFRAQLTCDLQVVQAFLWKKMVCKAGGLSFIDHIKSTPGTGLISIHNGKFQLLQHGCHFFKYLLFVFHKIFSKLVYRKQIRRPMSELGSLSIYKILLLNHKVTKTQRSHEVA